MTKKSVALVGFATTSRHLAHNLPKDIELWTLNRGWHFDQNFTKIDRLFDIHTLDYLSDPNNSDTRACQENGEETHWEWLQKDHDYPIYMIEAYPEVHNSVRYPLEVVMDDIFKHLWRNDERIELLSSGFDFMLALAIHEGYQRIEIYGFEMATGTEYQYQKNSGMLLMGITAGRGIDVVIPQQSNLIPRMKIYGYEGAQMISRQTLESYARKADEERDRFRAVTNARIGAIQQINNNGHGVEEMAKAQEDYLQALQAASMWDGVRQVLNLLIAECDMLEVSPDDIEAGMSLQPAFEGVNDGNNN